MRIPIVFSTDHNYVMPTCVTIHSLLATSKEETLFDIYVIIDSNVTEQDKAILESQVKKDREDCGISFLEIGDTFNDGFEIRGISKACYNRLMIPWLLPQYDKVIYSDVDIIFMGDISDVYDIDWEDHFVAGVGGKSWTKGIVKKYLIKIGADWENYINSGFLLINSKLQRERNLREKYLELSKKKFIYQDQDIINLVCKGKILKLPVRYNVNPKELYDMPKGEAKALHFFGFKPWQYFTYSWIEWWNQYNDSIVYDPQYAKNISSKILQIDTVFETKKKVLKQKMRFMQQYLSSK